MSAPVIPIPPAIATLTAPLLLGIIFSVYLYGVLSVQVYLYYITFAKDALYIKLLVYSVFAIESTATFLSIADGYHWFAAGYGNMLALDEINFSGIDTPMMGAILAAIVQTFYCYRIWRINKKAWPISVFIIMIALAQVGAGCYSVAIGKHFSDVAKKKSGIHSAYVLFGGAAAADTLIAVTIITLLRRSRQKAHKNSSHIVSRIITLTAETNLFSTFFACLTLILLLTLPNTNYFTAPSYILGKIYSNSLLLLLNNRQYLTNKTASEFSNSNSSYKMSGLRSGGDQSMLASSTKAQNQSIHIDVNTVAEVEEGTKIRYDQRL